MTQPRLFPNGPLVDKTGTPTNAGRAFLAGIEELSSNVANAGGLAPLSGDTNAANMSAKIDAIISALNGT